MANKVDKSLEILIFPFSLLSASASNSRMNLIFENIVFADTVI